MTRTSGSERRSGAATRAEILRVALHLFIDKGYEATSTRDISEALGLTKSALYYHFRNKEEILESLVEERRSDVEGLAAWVEEQPRTPDLPRRAVQRWLEGTSVERLRTMRLVQANQPLMRRLRESGTDPRSAFDHVIDLLAGEDGSVVDRLLIRMAFDTAIAALHAAQGTAATPEDVIAAARRAAPTLAALAAPSDAPAAPPAGPPPSVDAAGPGGGAGRG